LGCLKAVHHRHRKVQHDHIRLQLLRLLYSLSPIRGLSANLPATLLFQEFTQPFTDDSTVVDDKDVFRQLKAFMTRILLMMRF